MRAMRKIILAAAILLAACTKQPTAFEQARTKFSFLQQHGATNSELCKQAGIAADAAANESRAQDFEDWKSQRVIYCTSAAQGA
jgi:starvation-inducible outer membrane lipoprotein